MQTSKPLGVVNLRSFNVACLPAEDARTSGRSMDWCTCPHVLSSVMDDETVDDRPNRGIKGAPATHISLRDLGATGVLLLGTTSNLVLLLGFRRTRSRRRACLSRPNYAFIPCHVSVTSLIRLSCPGHVPSLVCPSARLSRPAHPAARWSAPHRLSPQSAGSARRA